MEKAKEYKKGSSTKQQSTNGVLCKHQDHKPFAYGLCQSCYDDVSSHVFFHLSLSLSLIFAFYCLSVIITEHWLDYCESRTLTGWCSL